MIFFFRKKNNIYVYEVCFAYYILHTSYLHTTLQLIKWEKGALKKKKEVTELCWQTKKADRWLLKTWNIALESYEVPVRYLFDPF